MTTYDYNIVMISANIANLKARLSYYLNLVKRGEEVLVLDRKTPIAKILASPKSVSDFKVIPAKASPEQFLRLKTRPLRHKIDVVADLREDRDRR